MKPSTLILSVLILGLSAVALPSVADACSCGPKAKPVIAMQEADAVFVGQMVGSRRLPADKDGALFIEYQFEISHSYKGPIGRAVVRTPKDSSTCGRQFEDGLSYLVYAERGDSSLMDSLCSRTALVSDADEDFADLGSPPGKLESAPAGEGEGTLRGPKSPAQTTIGHPGTPPSIASSPSVDIISSQCHTVLDGTFDAKSFTDVVAQVGAGGFVCTRDVTVEGNVKLDAPGLRLVALEYGGLRLKGNVLIASPTVLLGATISGTVLMSERADGSVLVGNTFQGDLVSATSQIIGVGNTCSQQCASPSGALTLGLYVPRSATGVLREVPRTQVAEVPREADGSFMGWHSPETEYRPRYEDRPVQKDIDLGDLTNEWPPPVCDLEAGCGFVPVYGRTLQEADATLWGVYVPLEAGRFRNPELGFLYIP